MCFKANVLMKIKLYPGCVWLNWHVMTQLKQQHNQHRHAEVDLQEYQCSL